MGLFSAIKSGLAKTRDALLGELKGIVGAGKITDETLEELEEHLIKADVGVEFDGCAPRKRFGQVAYDRAGARHHA